MRKMEKLYFFYNIDTTLTQLIKNSEGKIIVKQDGFETILKFKNSEILLINENGNSTFEDDTKLWGFLMITKDIEILKYLYVKHKIMFLDIESLNNVSYLNSKKHQKYITHIINEYVYETLLQNGIISDLSELENHITNGKQFFNDYVIEKGQLIRYKIVKREYIKYKIKSFFKKIYEKILWLKKK